MIANNIANKSNIVYYPATTQTVYVQAIPVQSLPVQSLPMYTSSPPAFNPNYIQPPMANYNISNNTNNNNTNNTNNVSKTSYQPPRMWQTGMLDCFTDCGICFYGCFCPCCLHGMNAQKFYDKSCLSHCLLYLFCCGPLQQCNLRSDLRKRYNLQQSPCNDCCVAFCCGPCGMCQEAREIEYRKVVNGPVEANMS